MKIVKKIQLNKKKKFKQKLKKQIKDIKYISLFKYQKIKT